MSTYDHPMEFGHPWAKRFKEWVHAGEFPNTEGAYDSYKRGWAAFKKGGPPGLVPVPYYSQGYQDAREEAG
jgi:hypothetical protein